MKKILLFIALFYLLFFGFAFLFDSAMERDSAWQETRQARFTCRESGLSLKECNFN